MSGICPRVFVTIVSIAAGVALLRGQNPGVTQDPSAATIDDSSIASPARIIGSPIFRRDPRASGATAFQRMVNSAGIIFLGRVTAAGSPEPFFREDHFAVARFERARDSTSITFSVEKAIRGATAGQSLVIHEWAGLWTKGERYRVGEQVLLFLYPPSRLGLTSPVGGSVGRFVVDSGGRVVLHPGIFPAFATNRSFEGKDAIPYADFARAVRNSLGKE
jgi:hypothetical protein